MEHREVVIIGTGPAGLTAAVYTGRAELKPLVFEGPLPGGQLTLTTDIENFPGFVEGISGSELMGIMRKQAERFGAEYRQELIVKVDFSKRPFTLKTSTNKTLTADSVIISTGASAKFLNLEGEKELIGRGVSTCATCDGFFYRDKVVHVVGGGDTAMEDANFLTKFAKKVYIIHRKDSLRASKPMQDRSFKNEKIEFIWNSEVKGLVSNDSGLTGLKVLNNKTGAMTERKTDAVFYGIGHRPNTEFLDGQITLDEHGFIQTHDEVKTNIEGVFACGDVQDSYYRQAISAAGSGCQAAIRAERFLSE